MPPTQKALIIWDVFKGLMTSTSERQITSACNGTCTCIRQYDTFFQPLDLTDNRAAKNQTKKEFISWHSAVVQQELHEGKALEDNVDVDLKLTVMKP